MLGSTDDFGHVVAVNYHRSFVGDTLRRIGDRSLRSAIFAQDRDGQRDDRPARSDRSAGTGP